MQTTCVAVKVSVYEVRDLDKPNKGKRSRDQKHLFYVCVVYWVTYMTESPELM